MRLYRFIAEGAAVLAVLAAPLAGRAQVSIGLNITVAPPVLPVYVQPPLPGPGYLWTPGYWAWGPYGYYWVPGTWVLPPTVGLLWTPGYWGWGGGVYLWHAGYWGPHVGFYGGVNYGFGYIGTGYAGGFWRGGAFHYNSAVNNFGGVHITNVYRQTTFNNVNIVRNTTINRVSYNGGAGGLRAQPTPAQAAFAHEQHVPMTPVQQQHMQAASGNHALLASVNHGQPAIAATREPGRFEGPGVVAAHPAPTVAHNAIGGPQHPAGHYAAGQHPAQHYAATPHYAGPHHPAPHYTAHYAPHPAAHAAPHEQHRPG